MKTPLPPRELAKLIELALKARPGFERVFQVHVLPAAPEVGWVAYAVDLEGTSVARLECERISAGLRERFCLSLRVDGDVLSLPKTERKSRERRSRADIEALILQDVRRRWREPEVTAVTVARGTAGNWTAVGLSSDNRAIALPFAAPIIEAMAERYIIE